MPVTIEELNSTAPIRIEQRPGGSFRAVIETTFDAAFLDDIHDKNGDLIPEKAIRLFLFQMAHGPARIRDEIATLEISLNSGGEQHTLIPGQE